MWKFVLFWVVLKKNITTVLHMAFLHSMFWVWIGQWVFVFALIKVKFFFLKLDIKRGGATKTLKRKKKPPIVKSNYLSTTELTPFFVPFSKQLRVVIWYKSQVRNDSKGFFLKKNIFLCVDRLFLCSNGETFSLSRGVTDPLHFHGNSFSCQECIQKPVFI